MAKEKRKKKVNEKVTYKNFLSAAEKFNSADYGSKKYYKDFLSCKRKFLCRIDEYFLLKLYAYKNSYRKLFLTKDFNRKYLSYVNKHHSTRYKSEVYAKLKKYYHRELFSLSDCDMQDFFDYVAAKGTVIVKPDDGTLGNGIAVLEAGNINKCTEYYLLAKKHTYICEEYIKQHPAVSELCPVSVNTCRFLTLYDGKEVKIVSASIKMSKGKNRIDNMSAGGLGASIDTQSGIISTMGEDYCGNMFARHPLTNKVIAGTQLPDWEKAVELIKNVAKDFPECSVIGADVAFAEDGPCLVELNNAPGPLINQLASGKPCGKEIKEFIKHNHIYKQPKNKKGDK